MYNYVLLIATFNAQKHYLYRPSKKEVTCYWNVA